MRHHPLSLGALLTCLCLAAPASAEDTARLRAQNEQLQATNQRLQKQIDALKAQVAELQATLNQTSAASEELQTQVQDLAAEKQQLEALAGVTAKGEIVASQTARFEASYDAAEDQTTVTGPGLTIDFGLDVVVPPHQLAFSYAHAGKQADAAPSQYTLTLRTAKNTHKRYKKAEHLHLMLDGGAVTLPLASYTLVKTHRPASARSTMKRYDEKIDFSLTPDQLRRFARATSASAKLATADLPLSREHIALAKATLERSRLLAEQ